MHLPILRVRMTKRQQLQVSLKSKECSQMTNLQLATWAEAEFRLPKRPSKPAVITTLRKYDDLRTLPSDCLSKRKTRSQHLLQLDAVVAEFIIHSELKRTPISGGVTFEYAKGSARELGIPPPELPQFIYTERAHDESSSVDHAAIDVHMPQLRNEIKNYHPNDVYNMDETAFYYMVVPRTSVCLNAAPALKLNKARLTVAVATNASGSDKLPLLLLGEASCPRWLHEKPEDVEYAGTSKGWMTVRVFQKWLTELNDAMIKAGRKILLLLDNAPVHIEPDVSLANVHVLKLPPNTTAVIQPMDQGVIAYIKRGVMSLKSEAAMYRLLDGDDEPYKVRLADAIQWLQTTRNSMPAEAIENCWKHSGLIADRGSLECILNIE